MENQGNEKRHDSIFFPSSFLWQEDKNMPYGKIIEILKAKELFNFNCFIVNEK